MSLLISLLRFSLFDRLYDSQTVFFGRARNWIGIGEIERPRGVILTTEKHPWQYKPHNRTAVSCNKLPHALALQTLNRYMYRSVFEAEQMQNAIAVIIVSSLQP